MNLDKKSRECRQLLEYAKTLRRPHETEIRDAYLHTFPSREFDKEAGQEADRTKLYDATAIEAALALATTTMRLLIPQSRPWCQIGFKTEYLKRNLQTQFAQPLDIANDLLFQHFSKSNFYLTCNETIQDAITCGTACLAFIDGDGPLSYMAVPTAQLYFLEDFRGRVDCVFREHSLTARQVKARFNDLDEDYEDNLLGQPDKKIKLVEAVIPNGGKFDYCIYDAQSWEPLEHSESQWNPFVVWRWDRSTGEVWGESPIRHALPNIRSANTMKKSMIMHGEYAALGLWQVNDESINIAALSGRMVPGSVVSSDEEIKPVQFPGNFAITEAMINDERGQIRNLTHANTAVRNDGENTYMTAAEVAARRESFYEKVGGPAQRLQWEFLQPVAEQAVGRLQARGELPPVPPEMIRQLVPGARDQRDILSVEVNAAITKSLRHAKAQEDLTTWSMAVQAFGPDIAGKHVNVDQLARRFYENAGISSDLMRDEKEVAAIEQQQAQQKAAAMAMELAATPTGKAVVDQVAQQNQPAP